MRVLVTGGAGFVGVNLCRHLRGLGHELVCFDNFSSGSADDAVSAGFDSVIEGDVLNRELLASTAMGADAVVHLAAQAGVPSSIADPWFDAEQNVLGTLSALMAARDGGVGRFVFASSAAPLGGEGYPANELCLTRPISPYGASKTAGEAYCSAFSGSFDMRATALRFSNLYGPFSYHKGSVIAHYMKSALAGSPLQINGTGEQTRDFLYVDDLVAMIGRVLAHPDPGVLYQLGSNTETSIVELVRLMGETFGQSMDVEYASALPGDIIRSRCDTTKAVSDLGAFELIPLRQGLEATRAWFETLDKTPGLG